MMNIFGRIALTSCLLLAAAALAVPARAQGEGEAEAKALYKEGALHFEAGRFEEASKAFRAAYEAKPSWKLQYNIGQSEAAARRYGQALDAFDLEAGRSLMIQSSAYLAATPTIQLDTKWGGAKGFFSGVGMFLLKASGPGTVFVSSYGAIYPKRCDGQYIVDTDHIVAFQDSVTYSISKVGGIKSLFFGGEGLVAKFSGQGMIYAQTRSPSSLAAFLHPYRPVKNNN